jgi:hypothetical protein
MERVYGTAYPHLGTERVYGATYPPLVPERVHGTAYPPLVPERVHDNLRCLDDSPHPKLDLQRLYRCNRRIHQKTSFLFVKLLLPQFTPEKP